MFKNQEGVVHRRLKNVAMAALLVGIAIIGPMVAYAGVSVIWPSSTATVNVNQSPPINFTSGSDYTQANGLGFAGSFAQANNAASFTLTASGLSGGTVTIDNLTWVQKASSVSSFKVQVASALSGISPTTLKIRLWSGASAPAADGDAGVCAVLDLTAAANTESTGSCSAAGGVRMQLVYQLPSGQTTQSGTVSVRPSSIVFA